MTDHLTLRLVEETIDHLLLGVGDLDRGIEWVENLTGVKAVYGGSHPNLGTWNALLSLGGRRYLEIIAPDPSQPDFRFWIDLRSLTVPRLVSWAANTEDPDYICKVAEEHHHRAMGPQEGSRARPDGKVLRWATVRLRTSLQPAGTVEAVPFFIRWAGDSKHPSQDSPPGCELVSFRIIHPEPSRLTTALLRFGIQAQVDRGEQVALVANLQTPNGRVEIR
jgi:hypothetical protein